MRSAAPLCHIPAQKDLIHVLEQAFSAPQLPPGHRFPMVGAAAGPLLVTSWKTMLPACLTPV